MLLPLVELLAVAGLVVVLDEPRPRFQRSSKLPEEGGLLAAGVGAAPVVYEDPEEV